MNWMPVDRDLQRCSIEGDQGMTGSLIHMTVEIGRWVDWKTDRFGGVGIGGGGGVTVGRREEVCKSDNTII